MTEPTDADRTRAAEIAGWPAKNWTELRDAIAAALASERAAAVADLRARVLALAEEWEADGDNERMYCNEVADVLRAAVTDTTGGPA